MKKVIRNLAVFLAIFFLITACSHRNSYVNVLPSEASLVASIDVPSLIEKSGLSESDERLLKEKVGKILKGELRVDEAALVEKVVAHPEESGINWTDKVYMFVMPDNYATGVLASVDNRDKLEALLNVLAEQKVCDSFADGDGYRYAVSEGKFLLAYNEIAFLMVGVQAESEIESLKGKVKMWMNASKAQSYASTEGYAKLQAEEGDIKMDVSMNILPQQYAIMAAAGLPDEIQLKDVHSIVGICFEKGELDVNVENYYTNDKLEAQVERIAALYDGRTSGKFLDKFSDDVMFWVNTCVDGKELYSYLQENPSTSAQLKNAHLPVNLERILTALQGELALGISVSGRIPQLGLYVEVIDDAFLQELEAFKSVLETLGFRYGIEDEVFYLTNRKDVKDESLKNAFWADESKDKLVFFIIDVNTLKAMAPLLPASKRMAIEMMGTYIESVQIYASEVQRGHFVLKAVDKDTNILKQCIDLVKKTALN